MTIDKFVSHSKCKQQKSTAAFHWVAQAQPPGIGFVRFNCCCNFWHLPQKWSSKLSLSCSMNENLCVRIIKLVSVTWISHHIVDIFCKILISLSLSHRNHEIDVFAIIFMFCDSFFHIFLPYKQPWFIAVQWSTKIGIEWVEILLRMFSICGKTSFMRLQPTSSTFPYFILNFVTPELSFAFH